MGGRAGAEARRVQGFPLAAGAQHEQDGVHTDAVGGPGATAPEAVGVLVGRQQFLHALPHGVGDPPVIGDRMLVHGGGTPLTRSCPKPSTAAPSSYSAPGVIRIGSYSYDWYLYCPGCGAMYMVEEGKRLASNPQADSLFEPSKPES